MLEEQPGDLCDCSRMGEGKRGRRGGQGGDRAGPAGSWGPHRGSALTQGGGSPGGLWAEESPPDATAHGRPLLATVRKTDGGIGGGDEGRSLGPGRRGLCGSGRETMGADQERTGQE